MCRVGATCHLPSFLRVPTFVFLFVLLLGLIGSLAGVQTRAQVPDSVSYQGTVTDPNGTLVQDGTYELTFRLYADSTGGTSLWTETQQDVRVQDGVFSVILGVNEPLYTDTLSYDRPLWLSVEVENSGELSPRTPLTAVPYAVQAHRLDRTALEAGAGIQIQEIERDSLVGLAEPLEDDNILRISATGGGDGGNTLDQAYNEGGAGAGRSIDAVNGPVQIDGSTIAGPALPAGQSTLVQVTNLNGHGRGLDVFLSPQAPQPPNPDNAVHAQTTSLGAGVYGAKIAGGALPGIVPSAGVSGESNQKDIAGVAGASVGLGSFGVHGIIGKRTAAGPALLSGVYGESPGVGFFGGIGVTGYSEGFSGVFGELGPPGDDRRGRGRFGTLAGVYGVTSVKDRFVVGTFGHSVYSPGVGGHTQETGTYPEDRDSIEASVQGWSIPAKNATPEGDHFAVAGTPINRLAAEPPDDTTDQETSSSNDLKTPDGTTTTGVLGIGHGWGTGVLGIPGNSESETGAGVRGVTSEGDWPSFPLKEPVNKRNVGVLGQAKARVGVWGESISSKNGRIGVVGNAGGRVAFAELPDDPPKDRVGVYGTVKNKEGVGVLGAVTRGIGVWGEGGTAGWFEGFVQINGDASIDGDLNITGSLSKGSGSFTIDHPQAPKKKTLSHSFVESPDMMNVYNGTVRLDEEGEAWVRLPDYFEALNKDYRYQLTAIGAPAPRLHVAQRIEENRFKIAGGKPGMTVSWEVTGVRDDPYARENRIPVEKRKSPDERGEYLHPEAYGGEHPDEDGDPQPD